MRLIWSMCSSDTGWPPSEWSDHTDIVHDGRILDAGGIEMTGKRAAHA